MFMAKKILMITIQLDMFLAERFDMTFVDKDGEKKRPYIIHRTAMGCYERTLAWLIEKYAGLFPTWFVRNKFVYFLFQRNITITQTKLLTNYVATA